MCILIDKPSAYLDSEQHIQLWQGHEVLYCYAQQIRRPFVVEHDFIMAHISDGLRGGGGPQSILLALKP